MSNEATDKSGKTWLYVVGFLVGLAMLYVLSIGPAFVLIMRKVLPNELLGTFYRPLDLFVTTTGTNEAIKGYIMIWLRLTGTPEP